MEYQTIIGLEIHVELKTKTKMFCACLNDPDEKRPNFNICPICLGHPGTLPVINREAVKKVIKTGQVLNCQLPQFSKFDRKNYFYPDLPKGYQISQYDEPFCINGYLDIDNRKIRIRRIHLEEDTGRLIHEKEGSLIDFNRAGIPLMELVTEPDIHSGKEARVFAQELQLILRYLAISDADMEKGQMRVEVNISLMPKGQALSESNFGTKVEIKNLNSFKSVERAVDYEIKRQTETLESEKKIIQETRGWNDVRGETFSQREKEEAHDYRYFPEPDLPVLCLGVSEILKEIKKEIPELPSQKRKRLKKEYQLDEKSLELFVQNKDLGEYFEKVVSEFESGLLKEKLSKLIKLSANYLITDLQGLLQGKNIDGQDFLITPENFSEFITLIEEGKISSKIAKMVLEEMFKTGADPSNIIEKKELSLITSQTEIENIIKEVISKNQKAVEDFKKGKESAITFLIGQVMSISKGKASPEIVSKTIREILTKNK